MYIVDVHVLVRDEKEERSKQGQTNNKAKQHSTPKAVTFPKKNKLPRVEPTTLYALDRVHVNMYVQVHVLGKVFFLSSFSSLI